MTQASAPTPATANFINPEGMHRPTGYTHVVEASRRAGGYLLGSMSSAPR
jgi:hypothetical protein